MVLVDRSDLDHTREQLRRWLDSRIPGDGGVVVSDLEVPAASGFSNETLFFTANWLQSGRPMRRDLVARIEVAGAGLYPVTDVGVQYEVMAALGREAGVPVPRMLWYEADPSILGTPFFVMERVEGRIPTDDPPFTATGWVLDLAVEQRAILADNALEALVAIHALDPDTLDLDILNRPHLGSNPLDQEITFYENYYVSAADGRRSPILDAGLDWIRANRPACVGPAVLSWGDARIGNMIFGEDLSVAAVLDWEMASFAAPEHDLGWWLHMIRHHTEGFGLPHPDGFPRREDVISRYEDLSGRGTTGLSYYETFAALRGSVITMRLANMMIDAGLLPPDSEMAENNPSSRILADPLGLPVPPGAGMTTISKMHQT